jgi:hypothetical protein
MNNIISTDVITNIVTDDEYYSCEEEPDEILVKEYGKYFFINKELYENIQRLPNQLRNKLYIYTMRKFWRKYIPLTAKVPIWNDYANYQRNLLFQARQHNIHFLHLPCNTLPHNKQYIVGCQCDDCLYKLDKNIHREENEKQYFNPFHFFDTIPQTGSNWNYRIEILNNNDYEPIFGYPIFNPDYDIYEPLKYKILGKPIHFN